MAGTGWEAVCFSCRAVAGTQTTNGGPVSAGDPCTAQHVPPYCADFCSGSVGTRAGREGSGRGINCSAQSPEETLTALQQHLKTSQHL